MINITLKDLNVLQKYFHNRVGYNEFKDAMQCLTHHNEAYIDEAFHSFQKNYIAFFTDRNEELLFEHFLNEIDKLEYEG